MTTHTTAAPHTRPQWGLALLGLAALAVAGVLAAYGLAHAPSRQPIFTLGFTAMLPMKVWLTTGATVLVVVQILSALAMWGKLPGAGRAVWAPSLHRWSGTVAFVLTLPVAFHCVWALGFATADFRTVVHSVLGCLFYGIFTAKMLSLRMHRLPGWTLPALGGLLAVTLTGLWFTASFWYFSQPSLPVF